MIQNSDIKGKKILLLMPTFFNYQQLLIEELESKGAIVDFVENKQLALDFVSPTCKLRFIRKILFSIFDLKWNYIKSRINLQKKYDIFLCVNGFSFDKKIISSLKSVNPDIKTILYLWDSTSMYDWGHIVSLFDTSFTFDPLDAQKLGIKYLANFYPKNINCDNLESNNSIFFVGTQHSDRYYVIKSILEKNSISTNNIKLLIKYKHFLHNKLVYRFMKNLGSSYAKSYSINYELVEKVIKDDFLIYDSIRQDEILSMMQNSCCVLDIQAPTQVGLPHQMIMALAMGKKIITVNGWIKNYDFYDSKQILIIDRNNPIITNSFIFSNFNVLEIHKSIKKSRIDNWVNEIVS